MRGVCFTVLTGVVVMMLFVGGADGMSCLECNVYFQGRRGTACHSPIKRTECVACMKVVTKIQTNDGWLVRRTASVVSRYCARVAGSVGLRDEGCYYQQNNGGYTEQCFCYTDDCNHGTTLFTASSVWSYVVMLSLALCAVLLSR